MTLGGLIVIGAGRRGIQYMFRVSLHPLKFPAE